MIVPNPPSQTSPPWTDRRILTLLALGTLIVLLVWRLPDELAFIGARTAELVLTLTIAMAGTYILRPVVNALNRTKVFGRGSHSGRMGAALAVFVIAGALLYGFCAISFAQVSRDVRQQSFVKLFMAQTTQQKREMLRNWRGTLKPLVQPVAEKVGLNAEQIVDSVPIAIDWLKPRVVQRLEGLTHSLSFIVELILLPVLIFYFLSDGPAIRREAKLLFPLEWRARIGRMTMHLDRVLDGYIRGQMIMCVIAWIMVSLILLVLGVPHWFTLGLVAGLTRAVPVIGPLLGAIPLVLVCLITTRDLGTTGLVLVAFIAMHLIESKILLPRIVGHEVDLHPVSVIVALLLGLKFFGFLGVFLAVPIAAVVKILLAEWHEAQAARLVTIEPALPASNGASFLNGNAPETPQPTRAESTEVR